MRRECNMRICFLKKTRTISSKAAPTSCRNGRSQASFRFQRPRPQPNLVTKSSWTACSALWYIVYWPAWQVLVDGTSTGTCSPLLLCSPQIPARYKTFDTSKVQSLRCERRNTTRVSPFGILLNFRLNMVPDAYCWRAEDIRAFARAMETCIAGWRKSLPSQLLVAR